MMTSAGYEEITFQRVDEKIMIGMTHEECIAFALAVGPAGEVFREAGEELAKARRGEIEADRVAYFETLERNDFGIWVISVHNPG